MADPVLMTADAPSVSEQTAAPIYGLFLNGKLILEPDSFISYSYMNESRLSQYPQEAGGFQQYNKVGTPFDLRIQVTKGGSVTDVAAFIDIGESLAQATDQNMYDLITPEAEYLSVNVSKVSHEHKPGHGANMVTMDIQLTEIRVTASAFYSNTASPTSTGNLSNTKTSSAADPKSAGTVQPQTPTPAQITNISQALKDAETAQNHAQMSH